MEEDSFVDLALRFGRNGRTKGHRCQCLAGAQPLLSHCLAVAQPLLSRCLAVAQPLLSHCLAVAQLLLSRCLAVTQPLLSCCLAVAYPLLSHCLAVAQPLLSCCLAVAQLLLCLKSEELHVRFYKKFELLFFICPYPCSQTKVHLFLLPSGYLAYKTEKCCDATECF